MTNSMAEIEDSFPYLKSEEEEKKIAYDSIRERVEGILSKYWCQKYGLKEGDSVFHAEDDAELIFQSFSIYRENRDLNMRPFILARPKFPYGLGKQKIYYPVEWLTKDEKEKNS